ncbi:MAG TPA: hypothetical protein VJT49_23775 [Amycolatopsis sp.]|uniref:hypothetical protein n=1 Tax=Amycolatopsis sp. TaxID=37632 RepID=UPI002B48F521|nr:hypothetical protein [Amycolatopsis sp.]HKS48074.1 hypothetical protein [Amycolatopsis sp.]
MSLNRHATERSPEEQAKHHAKDGDVYGFRLHDKPYREIGSASRYRQRERVEFPKLIKDLQTGQADKDAPVALAVLEEAAQMAAGRCDGVLAFCAPVVFDTLHAAMKDCIGRISPR